MKVKYLNFSYAFRMSATRCIMFGKIASRLNCTRRPLRTGVITKSVSDRMSDTTRVSCCRHTKKYRSAKGAINTGCFTWTRRVVACPSRHALLVKLVHARLDHSSIAHRLQADRTLLCLVITALFLLPDVGVMILRLLHSVIG